MSTFQFWHVTLDRVLFSTITRFTFVRSCECCKVNRQIWVRPSGNPNMIFFRGRGLGDVAMAWWQPNLAKNELKSYKIGDNFSRGRDVDKGFSSEIGFLLSANSTRTFPCVRNKESLPWQPILGLKQIVIRWSLVKGVSWLTNPTKTCWFFLSLRLSLHYFLIFVLRVRFL